MTEIVVLGKVQTPDIDYADVPMAYWPSIDTQPNGNVLARRDKVSAVCRSMGDCNDLVHWFGNQPDFCPYLPILLLIPDAHTLLTGLGYATAAELRDCACETWGVKTGADAYKRFNNDELRERSGLARKEDVQAFTQEAFAARIRRHKASPITDPWKQFKYPNPTQRTLHKTPDPQDWKAN